METHLFDSFHCKYEFDKFDAANFQSRSQKTETCLLVCLFVIYIL